MASKVRKDIGIAALVIGILQVIIGLVITIISILFASKASGPAPFWTGIPLIVAGGINIGAGISKSSCLMIASLVISIILFILTLVGALLTMLATAIYSAVTDYLKSSGCGNVGSSCVCTKGTVNNVSCEDVKAIKTLLQCLTAFGCLGALCCLAASIVGCMGVCCSKPSQPTVIMAPGQNIIVSQGQVQPPPPAY